MYGKNGLSCKSAMLGKVCSFAATLRVHEKLWRFLHGPHVSGDRFDRCTKAGKCWDQKHGKQSDKLNGSILFGRCETPIYIGNHPQQVLGTYTGFLYVLETKFNLGSEV